MASKQATAIQQKTWSVLLPIWSIFWFKDLNLARPTGDYGKQTELDELKESMTNRGWIMDGDGLIVVEKSTADQVKRGMDERQSEWDALKATAKLDPAKAFDLMVWESIFTEDGKLRQGENTGVTGNRRRSQYFAAMVERQRQKLPVTIDIPVKISHFETPMERLTAQIGENELKTLGFKEMTVVDCLLAAKNLVEHGAIANDLRKTFKDGTGQKLWPVIALDKRFPNLGLIEKMRRKPEEEGYINLASVSKEDVRHLEERTNEKELAAKNAKLAVKGETLIKPATEEEVSTYFAKPKEGGNKDKIMDRKNIQSLADNNNNRLVKMTAQAIIDKHTDPLIPFSAAATGFNALYDIVQSGDYPPVELILTKIITAGAGKAELLQKLLAVVSEQA